MSLLCRSKTRETYAQNVSPPYLSECVCLCPLCLSLSLFIYVFCSGRSMWRKSSLPFSIRIEKLSVQTCKFVIEQNTCSPKNNHDSICLRSNTKLEISVDWHTCPQILLKAIYNKTNVDETELTQVDWETEETWSRAIPPKQCKWALICTRCPLSWASSLL